MGRAPALRLAGPKRSVFGLKENVPGLPAVGRILEQLQRAIVTQGHDRHARARGIPIHWIEQRNKTDARSGVRLIGLPKKNAGR
jgi:hypothetical protein